MTLLHKNDNIYRHLHDFIEAFLLSLYTIKNCSKTIARNSSSYHPAHSDIPIYR